jgi:thiamine-monophosphate kinase
MLIGKIGEFGLIERIKNKIRTDASVKQGVGDDCAVINFSRTQYLLLTCDMLVEEVDFTSREKPYLIGRKALAVSISDIAACAGLPRYALVSLGLPPKTKVEFVDQLHKGMRDLARRYRVNLVGGDFSRAAKLILDVSMAGVVEKKKLVLRSGACRGDIIFASGTFGGSLRGKHLKFIPRVKEARWLVKNFKVNSMIDVSDGMVQDLGQILKASKVGAVIYEKLIPLSPEARSLDDALYSGEDFELLFTMSAPQAKRLLRKKKRLYRPIGEIVSANHGLRLIAKNGREKIIKPRGFRHF